MQNEFDEFNSMYVRPNFLFKIINKQLPPPINGLEKEIRDNKEVFYELDDYFRNRNKNLVGVLTYLSNKSISLRDVCYLILDFNDEGFLNFAGDIIIAAYEEDFVFDTNSLYKVTELISEGIDVKLALYMLGEKLENNDEDNEF